MLVVPLFRDIIQTNDGNTYKVVEYTNYKDGGPAVYAKSKDSKDLVLVYFFDIEKINKTKVEYLPSMKVFRALGKISRSQHLPQPDDKIIVRVRYNSDENASVITEAKSLKLKSKSLGQSKGLFVQDIEGKFFRIKDILEIDPSLSNSQFDREDFINLYRDYLGV